MDLHLPIHSTIIIHWKPPSDLSWFLKCRFEFVNGRADFDITVNDAHRIQPNRGNGSKKERTNLPRSRPPRIRISQERVRQREIKKKSTRTNLPKIVSCPRTAGSPAAHLHLPHRRRNRRRLRLPNPSQEEPAELPSPSRRGRRRTPREGLQSFDGRHRRAAVYAESGEHLPSICHLSAAGPSFFPSPFSPIFIICFDVDIFYIGPAQY